MEEQITCSCQEIVESMWKAMGCAFEQKPNAVLDTLNKMFAWSDTRWWRQQHAVNMTNAVLSTKKKSVLVEKYSLVERESLDMEAHMRGGTTEAVCGIVWPPLPWLRRLMVKRAIKRQTMACMTLSRLP